MAIATSNILTKQYDRDILDMFFQRYAKWKPEYSQFAKIADAPPGKTYRAAEMTGLGNAVEFPEGGGVQFDVPEEGHDKAVTYVQIGLGFQLTEIAREDKVHEPIMKVAGTIADGVNYRIETDFFKLFNLGNTAAASGGEEGWDGKPIFADNHVTLKSGDTINNLGTAALSETGLQAAFEYYDNLVGEEGRPIIGMKPDVLLVPTELRWTAGRLLRQMGGVTLPVDGHPNMGMNDMTTNPQLGYVGAWRLHISPFLDDPDNWFVTSNDHQLFLYWKRKVTMQAGDDFHTGNRLYKAHARYKAFCLDYKPVYGSFPT